MRLCRSLILSAAVAFSSTAPLVAQQQQRTTDTSSAELMAQARVAGQRAATNVGSGAWFAGGVVAGLFTGLVGTGVMWAAARNTGFDVPPEQRLMIAKEPASYQLVYEKAFGEQVIGNRKSSAVAGGLLGTAVFVALFVAATSK